MNPEDLTIGHEYRSVYNEDLVVRLTGIRGDTVYYEWIQTPDNRDVADLPRNNAEIIDVFIPAFEEVDE